VATQTFTHAAPFDGTIPQAWEALQNAETWGSIGGVDSIHDAHHDPGGNLLSYSFAAIVGGKRYPGRAKVTLSEEPHRMVVDIDTSELSGTITVALAPAPASGTVEVNLTVRSKGLLAGLMFPLIAGAIGSGLGGNVEAFATGLTPLSD
jgi:hypothetical protein